MSEQIYLLLLRLYPGKFRKNYGEEALLLFRDRVRDETGFLRRARLWFDLLLDLAALHIRGYHETVAIQAVPAQSIRGMPTFGSLEGKTLELRFVFMGGVLALMICGAVLGALGSGGRLPFQTSFSHALYSDHRKETPKILFAREPLNPAAGSTVRLSAVVSGTGNGPAPTGSVSFLDGWNVLTAGKLVNGSVTVEAKLPEGKKLPLNALYLGDENYLSANTYGRRDEGGER